MRLIYTILFAAATTLLFSQKAISQPTNQLQSIVNGEYKSALAKSKQKKSVTEYNYSVHYARCYWKIDPSINYISGAINTYFKITAADADSIQFDLSSNLVVDSVKYHNAPLQFSQYNDVVNLVFPDSLLQNTIDSVTIYYQGQPAGSGLGSFAQSMHNNTPIIWTLSEPYGAKDWWPCKQTLTDKIDSIDIYIETPLGNKAASNGLLKNAVNTGSSMIYYWKHRYPIATYLVALAVTDYAVYADMVTTNGKTIEILNYVYPEDSATAVAQTPRAAEAIHLFDSLFIPYPFANEKYGHAQFGWGGGMEHQTMSFMGNFEHELVAHELAHQWFGDKITCGSWQDIWLNEGFATYLTGLTYQYMFNGQYWMDWKTLTRNNVVSQPGGSVYVVDTTDVSRIFNGRLTYAKGAMVLHMLRWVVGDANFFAGVKAYLNYPSYAYKFATTTNFKAQMELASGQNLDEFFNDWVYGEGFPSYTINWNQNGTTVGFKVAQSTSTTTTVFFEMPLPIKLVGTTKDSMVVLNHTYNDQPFTFENVSFTLNSIEFDPEVWIVSADNDMVRVEEIIAEGTFEIFPNPASDYINIHGLKSGANYTLTLIDISGRIVDKAIFQANGFSEKIDLPSSLSKGLYLIGIESNSTKFTQKIAIQ